jgi:transposase
MNEKSRIDLQVFYPESLKIVSVMEEEECLILCLKSTKHSHCCPKCGQKMSAYHGTYERTVQDLPVFQKKVLLIITAYEYYCANKACEATTFSEDYEGFISRCGRMTSRLEDFILMLALETNCEGAAAICREMKIQVSGDTIIRMLRKLNHADLPVCGDTIGVDDFAYRKGQTYCTVICDEATHTPIEILDGRDGTQLKEWLRKNKQVKKVTRDRAGSYAKAISDELPQAMQIADRFHLHQNLMTAVKEALKHELPTRIAIPNEPKNERTQGDAGKKNGA